MSQQTLFFRPPSEASSFIVQTTVGCAHNKCRFCSMYKKVPFRVLREADIIAGMEADVADLGDLTAAVKSIFFGDGSAIVMRSAQILRIMEKARTLYPHLTRFACYGAVSHILLKTPEDLKTMAGLGLERIHCGVESGNDEVLRSLHKGCTRADIIRAGELLLEAGIELDASIMIGCGGEVLSEANARDTASALNACKPVALRIRTFTPRLGTAMSDDYLDGRFVLLNQHGALRELRGLIEQLDCATELRGDHWTNFVNLRGRLPNDREKTLKALDEALALPLERFRPLGAVDDGNF